MKCLDARQAISASFDGDGMHLDAENHLAGCSACAAYADDLQRIRTGLRFSTVGAMPDLATDVSTQIAARPQRSIRRRVGAAGMVAAALLLGVFVSGGDPAGPSTRPSAGPVAGPAQILLAWADGGLPSEISLTGLSPVSASTRADIGMANLFEEVSDGADGYVRFVPVEVLGYDPATYPSFASANHRSQLSGLGHDEAILSSSSAERRGGLTPGDRIVFDGGRELTVTAVVPDGEIVSAEVAVTSETARTLGADQHGFLLVEHTGENADVQSGITAELDDAAPGSVEFHQAGESPYLRGSADPLPQSVIKERFGEFSGVPYDDEQVVTDAGWSAANITSVNVPLLGEVRCHNDVHIALVGAMRELESVGLAHLIDPALSHRCWVPLVDLDADAADVRQASGITVDLNLAADGSSTTTGELAAVMQRWGFSWGGNWPNPQPATFEWIASVG